MTAELIDGRAVAAAVRARVAREIEAWVAEGNARPGLPTILVEGDPASSVYATGKRRACAEVGIVDLHRSLPGDASVDDLRALIAELGDDPQVTGILLQLPLPAGLDHAALTALIPPPKDVDGLTPVNAGLLALGEAGLRPCTPAGVIELLDYHGVALDGAEVVVVGRSNLVGKPVARLLLTRNATVTLCHSHTRELAAVCRRADVLVVAAGVPRMIGREHVKPGAVVIDVGINASSDGLTGDVDFEAVAQVASLLTPVPGGVGPMTVAMLLRNTLIAAQLQRSRAVTV